MDAVKNTTFAFITPSYAPDFQRCKLLCWSIKKFVTFPVKHYIVVDRRDLKLFRELEDADTIVLTKEDIFPRWIVRIPMPSFFKKNLWFNFRGYKTGNWLLRGWLVQQIIKLAAAQYAQEDVLVFVDSDVAFIDPFDGSTLWDGEKVRLFRVEHLKDMDDKVGRRWRQTAKHLLALPEKDSYYDFYVSQIVTWKRDNLVQMYRHIEKNFQRNWLEVITEAKDLSEYMLYGLFVNYALGEKSGHFDNHLEKICWCYWHEVPLPPAELKAFFQEAKSTGHPAVMVSAKSKTEISIDQFQGLLVQ